MDNNNLYDSDSVAQPGPESAAPVKPGYRAEVYDWLQCVVTALLFCVIVFVFFARTIGVLGTSMLPTLEEGDRVVISNLFYKPQNGDIIVFRKESFRHEPLVKRVIATGGQMIDIDIESGIVTVDGTPLQEDYTAELTYTRLDFEGPVTVPEGSLFVMGDNRNGSRDSRDLDVGFIDERYVMGKVYFIVMPLSNIKNVG